MFGKNNIKLKNIMDNLERLHDIPDNQKIRKQNI